jgi:hypothetical protein
MVVPNMPKGVKPYENKEITDRRIWVLFSN